jgi:iron complex outermembrane receptor protein
MEDKLGVSVAGFLLERDGYIDNLAIPSEDLGQQEAQGARVKILYQPMEQLKLTLAADMLYDTSLSPSFQRTVGPGATTGIRVVNLNTPPTTRRQVAGTSLTADYDLGWGMLTSITAYREANDDRSADLDVGPTLTQQTLNNSDQNQVSQEVRIASTGDGPLSYVAGLYYYHQNIYGNTTAVLTPAITPVIAGTVETTSYAAFANVDLRLLDDLTLTGGLRYTMEEKDLAYRQNGSGAFPNIAFGRDKQEDNDLSPTVSVAWQVTPDAMLYGTISKGFRSGGWNLEPNTSAAITAFSQLRFGPESVLSYEGGAKTSWLNGKLFVNAAAFFLKYDDLQVTYRSELGPPAPPGTFASIVTNAGAAQSQGFEMEMRWKMFEGFLLSGALGYVETEYTRYTDTGVDYAGKSLSYAPEWTANLSGQYDFAVGSIGKMRVRADYNYIGDFHTERSNDPRNHVDAHSVLNGRVVLMTDMGLDIAVFGNNLTDNTYYLLRSSNTSGSIQSVDFGMPRVVGLEVSVSY